MKRILYLVPLFVLLLFWPVNAQTVHGILVTWVAGSNDVTFNVYRSTVTGGPYTQIKSGLTMPTFEDTTGVGGTKYFYVVTGVDSVGESAFSNESSATFPLVPAVPTGLQAVSN